MEIAVYLIVVGAALAKFLFIGYIIYLIVRILKRLGDPSPRKPDITQQRPSHFPIYEPYNSPNPPTFKYTWEHKYAEQSEPVSQPVNRPRPKIIESPRYKLLK